MTQQEAWLLACIIQAGEEQHGYQVLRLATSQIGNLAYLVVQSAYRYEDEVYIYHPRAWYELRNPSYYAMPDEYKQS